METGDSEGLFGDFLFRLCRKHHNGFSREFPEKTECSNSMSSSVLLGCIALCAYVSFCLPLNQAYLCKATCANENAVVPKNTGKQSNSVLSF